jgi:hypothetical protein
MRTLMSSVPKIAKQLERIADSMDHSTDFQLSFDEMKDKHPDCGISNQNVWEFVCTIVNAAQKGGVTEVGSALISNGARHDITNALDPDNIAIWWCVDDLECLAQQREEYAGKTLYDRSKFEDALYQAYKKHDASIGISWDVLEVYLDELCMLSATTGEE